MGTLAVGTVFLDRNEKRRGENPGVTEIDIKHLRSGGGRRVGSQPITRQDFIPVQSRDQQAYLRCQQLISRTATSS